MHGIIFTGLGNDNLFSRPAGAFRIRTFLEQHNYNIEVIDFFDSFTTSELNRLLQRFISDKTLFIGVSVTFFNNFTKINELFSIVKNKYPKIKTIIGGTEINLHTTENNCLNIKLVDRIIWGYAEATILHYLDFLTKKRLDGINWVPYHGTYAIDAEANYGTDSRDLTIEWKNSDIINKHVLPIEISRGCIFKCKFCQFPLLGKKKNDYIRDEVNITQELVKNYEKYGVTTYTFQDDTFNDNLVKLEKVANAIAKSNIKIKYAAYLRADLLARFPETISMLVDTGLISAQFGIESFKEEARKLIGKGGNLEKQFDAIKKLKSLGNIWTSTGLIVGLPYETEDEIYKTHEWFLNQNEIYFNRWQFYGLYIRTNAMTRLSGFDKEYAKYGYKLLPVPELCINAHWINDSINMTSQSAAKLADKLNKEIVLKSRTKYLSTVEKWLSGDFIETNSADQFEFMETISAGIKAEDVLSNNIDSTTIDNFKNDRKELLKIYKDSKLDVKNWKGRQLLQMSNYSNKVIVNNIQ
jgi:radical SAM superfamily enzyme YgiQ (UPF0313 family)